MKARLLFGFCVGLLLMGASCKKSTPASQGVSASSSRTATVRYREGDLTNEDIAACFKALDLEYRRFSCEFTKAGWLHHEMKVYRNGKEAGSQNGGMGKIEPGVHDFLFFVQHKSDTLSFGWMGPNGGSSGDIGIDKNLGCKNWSWIPLKELSETPQPVLVFVAQKDSLSSFNTSAPDFEAELAKYEYAIVASVWVGCAPGKPEF